MVEFDVRSVDVDISSVTEELEHKYHPAIRVLIRTDRSSRWVQLNLDKFYIVNNVLTFNGILSHTMYLNQQTFYGETEVIGWFAPEHKDGGLTILN